VSSIFTVVVRLYAVLVGGWLVAISCALVCTSSCEDGSAPRGAGEFEALMPIIGENVPWLGGNDGSARYLQIGYVRDRRTSLCFAVGAGSGPDKSVASVPCGVVEGAVAARKSRRRAR